MVVMQRRLMMKVSLESNLINGIHIFNSLKLKN